MRIRFNVSLEPELYDSHSYAITSLRQWQQVEKEREDEADTALVRRNRFHRNLYLSGLFLHELAPQLPSMLVQMLQQDKVNCKTLASQVRAVGLPLENANSRALTEPQWQKLTSLLESANLAAPPVETAVINAPATAINELALEQLQQQLSLLQQGQQQMLTTLSDIAATQVSAGTGSDLSDHFSQLKRGQDKLMSQINALREQVSGSAIPTTQALADSPSIETQLERASRVKSKGLW
ncbi:hypothetical protein L2719_09535 [Shewanella schlegeliana]|uniref:Uncharacterized protein n=1 Tax=Shewanella schlegeliana TaxID=190308 RepID=A0ABS1SVZ3_9GAMM|nr:hypothetical protein [Shewanella schlegeliana]MBL4912705.1 hypothetical protein [Shewanella schlegeliana]MCL1109785.1 hypothetical protein [Shewanella schlegeliana]GIU30307.1 hypothetical protein TUM4433_20630 [Shewanella schlegeliana]